jgi:hypothetical protein
MSFLMVLEPVLDRQSRHADVDAWLRRVPVWVQPQHRRMLKEHGRVEEYHVYAVVQGLANGPFPIAVYYGK